MRKGKIQIRTRLIWGTVIFTLLITLISMGVVYYWSFYHFGTIFEDRVIDEYILHRKQELGVENEWILGISTHSIDVVRQIHGDVTAEVIEDRAKKQEELSRLYRETIDGKHLMYTINLDTKNGETIYEYSIIKDIYLEIFPKIAAGFLFFSLILVALSICYTQYVSKGVSLDIHRLRAYTKRIARGKEVGQIEICTYDPELQALVSDLRIMKDTIANDNAMRQTTLQYISHEMKTPIMIIEGYATSAKDEIYPKGDLDSTLDTILTQTERMRQKVADLLTIVRLEGSAEMDQTQSLCARDCIQEVFSLLAGSGTEKRYYIHVDPQLYLYGNEESFKILFENLISNQLKYAKTMFSISEKIHGGMLSLYFYNDGPVISPEIRERIFQPFVKGYNGSTGLGLSICRTILRQLSGDIRLAETKNGTMFIVDIPEAHWSLQSEPLPPHD